MSSGTLRAEAICCALALLASSSRCERPASSALSACANPSPSSGDISVARSRAQSECSESGGGSGDECGLAPLPALGELRPPAGAISGAAAGRSRCLAPRLCGRRGRRLHRWLLGWALAAASLCQRRSVGPRRPGGSASPAWSLRLWGLGARLSGRAGSAFAIGVSGGPCAGSGQLPWWSGDATEGVPPHCLFSPRHRCCAPRQQATCAGGFRAGRFAGDHVRAPR